MYRGNYLLPDGSVVAGDDLIPMGDDFLGDDLLGDDLLGDDLLGDDLLGDDLLGDDLLGDDLLGDDLLGGDIANLMGDDLMGRRRRRRRQLSNIQRKRIAFNRKAKRQLQANALARAGNLPGGLRSCRVEPKLSAGPQNARQVLPLDSVSTIGAGVTTTITTRPQVRYQPDRLFCAVPALSFLINDIKIGNRSQFSNQGSVPADMFSPTAVNTIVHFDPADIAQDITLNVTNISAGALRFNGGFIGNACA